MNATVRTRFLYGESIQLYLLACSYERALVTLRLGIASRVVTQDRVLENVHARAGAEADLIAV